MGSLVGAAARLGDFDTLNFYLKKRREISCLAFAMSTKRSCHVVLKKLSIANLKLPDSVWSHSRSKIFHQSSNVSNENDATLEKLPNDNQKSQKINLDAAPMPTKDYSTKECHIVLEKCPITNLKTARISLEKCPVKNLKIPIIKLKKITLPKVEKPKEKQ